MANDQKRLVKRSNIYMEETSPKNPFGPNYELLSYPVKVTYKYNSILPYIQLSEEDAHYKRTEELRYTGWLVGGILGGAVLGMALRKYIFC